MYETVAAVISWISQSREAESKLATALIQLL